MADLTVLRSALIGTGAISAQHLTALERTPNAELVGVCDLSPVSAEYAASTAETAQPFTDVATMLSETQPDVVHVLTPPATHPALCSMALEAGANVICEKPLALDTEAMRPLFALAESVGRRITENHNYRFNEGVEKITAAVAGGALGDVREVEVRVALDVRDPGGRFADPNLPSPIHDLPAGVIHDFTTHLTYLLLHFTLGAEFEHVAAVWSNHGGGDLFKYDDLDATLIGLDQAGGPIHGHLRFSAYTAPETMALTVRGSAGYAETDMWQPYVRFVIPRSGGKQLSPIINHVANGVSLAGAGIRNVGRKLLQHGPYEGLYRFVRLTYEALATGDDLPVMPHHILAASELTDRMLRS